MLKPIYTYFFYVFAFFAVLQFQLCCLAQEISHSDENIWANADDEGPVVFLTVSSLASHPSIAERQLELNWRNIPVDDGESRIRLYTNDPVAQNANEYLANIVPNSEKGHYRTSVQFPRQIFDASNLTEHCLGFWIAFVREENVVSSSCLKAYPNWMYDRREIIGNASLLQLFIPGTHNAGSYGNYDPNDDTVFKRYLVTQDEDVWNQLVYGIRYIDLRVSYERLSGFSNYFWITHGVFRTEVPLLEVINDVKRFLNATQEIVIMDFHRFVNGFTGRRAPSRHTSLITFLEGELSDFMIPSSFGTSATLEELWQTNRRLYVGYASDSRHQSSFLFPAVRHLWGNKDNVQELFSYLNQTICSRRVKLTSAMAQLTPTTSGAIFDMYGGLRTMAYHINKRLGTWIRKYWRECSNIISTDFFLGNEIIPTAIQINEERFSPSQMLS